MEQTNIDQDLFGVFVKDRIQTGSVNVWEPMKKRKLQTWKTVGKKIKIVGTTQTVELQEDRNLFARMLLVCKSRPQIDIKKLLTHTNLQLFRLRCLPLTHQCCTVHLRAL